MFLALIPFNDTCPSQKRAKFPNKFRTFNYILFSTDASLLETNPAVNVKIPNGAIRSLLVENILEDTTYLYAVRAENQHGWGPWQQARMKIEVTQGADGRPGSSKLKKGIF